MSNKNEKAEKFIVTRSLRMPSKWMKGFFCGGILMALFALILALVCLIEGSTQMLGVAVILALLSAIWLFMVKFNSENNFGVSMISFGAECVKFYYYKDEYRLSWENVVSSGIEKTRLAYWVYLSDHELSAAEKKEFPENVKDGVMYYGYEKKAWDKMMQFAPATVSAELKAAKSKAGIK